MLIFHGKNFWKCIENYNRFYGGKNGKVGKYTKTDLESMEVTIETLQNRYVMEQLERSEEDIAKGRVRRAREFLEEL